jgi:hypothetical protein
MRLGPSDNDTETICKRPKPKRATNLMIRSEVLMAMALLRLLPSGAICSHPDLEDAMCFILNILGSGKLILSLIVSNSVNEVSRTSRRL